MGPEQELEERDILMLREFQEKSYVEMSDILNISANALNKRMKRIIRKVRQEMKPKGAVHLRRDVGHEYRDIIQASVDTKRIPQIDVEEQVMQRISRLGIKSQAPLTRGGNKSDISYSRYEKMLTWRERNGVYCPHPGK
ncbi:sigma factor-like helix-turn-helix DNA-binding protein [Paenibacillus zanthoxyli]|uniref:sigma factor-like helix-turn-helix DNA-binding protein n=1 Tax=Paenibacillus zanthoxyli TaxID=369399 RepID=UPI000470065B|nr:sigma factor-like helix-turn-helix DNA-binding protein [Paenibacillus zanthoxyli]